MVVTGKTNISGRGTVLLAEWEKGDEKLPARQSPGRLIGSSVEFEDKLYEIRGVEGSSPLRGSSNKVSLLVVEVKPCR